MMKTAQVKQIITPEKHNENDDKTITFGKHKGLTFKELFEKQGQYARWFHNITKEP